MKYALALLPLVAACAASEHAPGPTDLGAESITVAPVPVADDLGKVAAVADLDTTYVAFGDRGAIAVAGGKEELTDKTKTSWSAAAALPAADGTGAWPVGLSEGKIMLLRENIEDVTARYGIDEPVLDLVSCTPTAFFAVLDRSVVAVDVTKGSTFRYDTGHLEHVSAAEDRFAGVNGSDVIVVDITEKGTSAQHHELAGVTATAFDANRQLVTLTKDALYVEFHEVHRGPDLHGLSRNASRVWFGQGPELWALTLAGVTRASGGAIDPGSTLSASTNGDVWVLGAPLARFRPSAAKADWDALLPVYQQVCADCHGPRGASGIDLSTPDAWARRKAAIAKRVVEAKSMPPAPRSLDPLQLDVIRKWIEQ